ncbi:MAG: TlpA disulfide reductase family protein [Verrucomicrobiota bacterium]
MRRLAAGLLLGLLARAAFGELEEGDIVADFTLPRHGSQDETISLYDYEGHVIVLDFFAYWCGPCQTSSPTLEKDVADFYAERGGTQEGVPVTVLAVSIDNSNTGAVDSFVENAGLKLVGLDLRRRAWNQFSKGYVPHFAVVNGVKDSNFAQWEVLHTNYGFSGANFYRNVAETVVPGNEAIPSGFEAWASQNIDDAGSRGALADADGDGLSNLFEYACSSDPEDSKSRKPLECELDKEGRYVFRYCRSKSAEGVEESIEYSDDMVEWTPLGAEETSREEVDQGEFVDVELAVPGAESLGKYWRRTVRLNLGS